MNTAEFLMNSPKNVALSQDESKTLNSSGTWIGSIYILGAVAMSYIIIDNLNTIVHQMSNENAWCYVLIMPIIVLAILVFVVGGINTFRAHQTDRKIGIKHVGLAFCIRR